MKKGLVFLLGVLVGVGLPVGAALIYNSTQNSGYDMFSQPGEEIPIKGLMVIQVLPDGAGLATTFDDASFLGAYKAFSAFADIVVFIPEKGAAMYDNLTIDVPKGKKVRQVGTYRYTTKEETVKTVPVVRFFDK